MMNGLVSIILPVYNCEKYIEESVESIIRQSYKNWELLIVDDGSKDNSYQICERLAAEDERISLFRQENGGVASARNHALRYAKGEYVAFVDGDDTIKENAIETLVSHSSGVDLVICGIESTDGVVDIVAEQVTYYNNVKETAANFGRLYVNSFYNSLCNKLFRRELITFRFDEEISHGSDLLFNLKYDEFCGKICAIPDMLYYYRVETEGSITKKYAPDTGLFLTLLFNRLLDVVGDIQEVRNVASCSFIEILLVQTVRLMRSSKSFSEKRSVIRQWSRYDVIRDKRLNKKSAKNFKHRIVLSLYQMRLIGLIMLLCR